MLAGITSIVMLLLLEHRQFDHAQKLAIDAVWDKGGEVKFNTKLATLPVVEVTFSHCKVTDSDLANLKAFDQLERLRLNNVKITDAGLAHLAGLKELRSLEVFDTEVTGAGLNNLRNLKKLKTLYLGFPVTDTGIRFVAELTNLSSLTLAGSRISDDGLIHLKDLKALSKLNLAFTRVNGHGLARLKELGQLEELGLWNSLVIE
jgi:hypothetical protein